MRGKRKEGARDGELGLQEGRQGGGGERVHTQVSHRSECMHAVFEIFHMCGFYFIFLFVLFILKQTVHIGLHSCQCAGNSQRLIFED